MNMDRHVSHTGRLTYHRLRSIAKAFSYRAWTSAMPPILHRLQVVQNSAARLIMRVRQREHITPILFALHWLLVRQRIQFKILTLVYRCQNHQAPAKGVVHNCQHLCISTESTRGRGVRGQRTIFKMLINLWNIL